MLTVNYAQSQTYFDINKLSLNIQKCPFMLTDILQSLAKMADVRIYIKY